MAINDIVQTIAEARVDARSLSEFVFKPSGFKVARRLAPTIDTLQFYINRFNSLNGDFSSSVSVALSSLNSSVAEAEGKVTYIETTVRDAITNTIISSGFITIDSFELGATITQRNQALRHALDGKLYRWAGDLPKVVPASSTPTSSGGVGANKWLEVSDTVLRQELSNLGLIGEGAENISKNRVVFFEDVVSDTTGITDVTSEMQALLDSHDGDIHAKPTSIFKTSKTLFNKKSNRTIDFKGAKIVNKTNSRYAIVTISPAFTGTTDAEMSVFFNERHYGSEVEYSHVKDLRYEMLSNTNGGSNLGVGIVYGYKCTVSKMFPQMTNGNGIEIRNSLNCGVYDSELYNHRSYACFVFMSKLCDVIGNKFKGGFRSVAIKMNRDGDAYCGHVVALNTFEGLWDTSDGGAIAGGAWKEVVGSQPIYVAGHEIIGNVIIRDNYFLNSDGPQSIGLAVFTKDWKVYGNTFKWNNQIGTVFTIGGAGAVEPFEKLGGNHEIYDNYIYDYNSSANGLITAQLSCRIHHNHFINCRALYWVFGRADMAGNKLDYIDFYSNYFDGESNGTYCRGGGQAGFSVDNNIKSFKFIDNVGKITAITNGANDALSFIHSSADETTFSGGDISLIADSAAKSITAAVVTRGIIKNLTGITVTISAPVSAIGLHILSGVLVEGTHTGNTYKLIGTAATARGVYTKVDIVDGVNAYIGSWLQQIYNDYEKPTAKYVIERQSRSMPIKAAWAKGDFVRNTEPNNISGSVVFGWLRITTGSAHVLGVDWIEIKQAIA